MADNLPDAPWLQIQKKPSGIPDAPWVKPKAEDTQSSYIGDILRSVGTGLRRGMEGGAGMGGDIYKGLAAGSNWLSDNLAPDAPPPVSGDMRDALEVDPNANWLPSSQDVHNTASEYIGESHEPQTEPGKWAATAGEYLLNPVGGLGKKLFRKVVAPTIGTEAGGKVGEFLGNETLGRLAGGGIGGGATGAGLRGMTGPQVSSERQRLAKLMADKGVELTGGQVSGNKKLQSMEVGPWASKPANMAEKQGRQYNRAALKEAGIDADEVTPEVLDAADEAFGKRYKSVVQQVGGIPLDSQLETDLLANIGDFERLKGIKPGEASAAGGYFQRISDAAAANNNVVPADIFQQISSDISKDLRKLRGNPQGNAELMDTLREFRGSMFESVGRSGKAEAVADWKQLNREYRNYKDIERAMYGPGEATAEGMISPAKLRTSVAAGDKAGTLRERGDLAGQAKAGANLMTELPQSGTPQRMFLPALATGAAGMASTGNWKEAIALMLSGGLPAGVASTLTSKPVRTALVRQATNPLPMLDPGTAALASFMAQPPPERNR